MYAPSFELWQRPSGFGHARAHHSSHYDAKRGDPAARCRPCTAVAAGCYRRYHASFPTNVRPFRPFSARPPSSRGCCGAAGSSPHPFSETSASAGSRLGWVGPPAWPSAYEDMLGFTFWPDDYASRLRGRGFDVIADTITGRFDLPRPSARTATTGAAVRNDADNETSVERCGDTSSTESNWPTVRVEQILQLSDAQHAALEKLQLAAAQSVKKSETIAAGLVRSRRPTG